MNYRRGCNPATRATSLHTSGAIYLTLNEGSKGKPAFGPLKQLVAPSNAWEDANERPTWIDAVQPHVSHDLRVLQLPQSVAAKHPKAPVTNALDITIGSL